VVPLPNIIVELVRARTSAPRSIIGFLLTVYTSLTLGSVIVIGLLVSTDGSEYIGYVLGFDALITVGLLVAVIWITARDGSRLMLGPVNAREFAAIRYIKTGDDASGERVERLLSGPTVASDVDSTAVEEPYAPQLSPGTEPDIGEET
jgi:hypothetical protein